MYHKLFSNYYQILKFLVFKTRLKKIFKNYNNIQKNVHFSTSNLKKKKKIKIVNDRELEKKRSL